MASQAPSSATASFSKHLQTILPAESGRSSLCTSVIPALLDSIVSVAAALRVSHHVALAGGTNAFGDDQLNVDVTAENLIREALAGCPTVVTASSEEDPIEKSVHATPIDASAPEVYTVAFDPLDGSSIIAPNWTVGTIAGIWDGPTAIGSNPATAQIVSLLGVYGPRTTAVLALRVPGYQSVCIDLGYTEGANGGPGSWDIINANVRLAEGPVKVRYFSPANLRACVEDELYNGLIKQYIAEKYTLRYAGGLVPDVIHQLVKGHGVYVSPVTPNSKAKLRRLYELCPMALIMECVGGKAVAFETFTDVLDTPLGNTDERGGIIFGTAYEVVKASDRLRR